MNTALQDEPGARPETAATLHQRLNKAHKGLMRLVADRRLDGCEPDVAAAVMQAAGACKAAADLLSAPVIVINQGEAS